MADVDFTIIGAGIVGCAVASQLSRQGFAVALLERADREGTGITSRNSGVIHGGLYYPPGSRKARSCVEGRKLLYAWAQEHQVPHRKTGKLIVAHSESQLGALDELYRNAIENGVDSCCIVDRQEIKRREPTLPDHPAALWSPETGIVDVHALTRSFMIDAEKNDALLGFQSEVVDIESKGDHFVVQTARGPIESTRVINCAGLFADRIAAMVGLQLEVRPCRGDYFRLHPHPDYKHLVYPLKDPTHPGLGVHLTLEMDGSCLLGPDVQWVDDKEDFSPADHKHEEFLASARKLLGDIRPNQIRYDSCGLRPKISAPGQKPADFEILEQPEGIIHLMGIESPGVTASLALAKEVSEMVKS